MKRVTALMLVAGTIVSASVLLASPASAHEARTVNGYHWLVGFGNEPTYAGFQNYVVLFLNDPSGAPVLNIGDKLHVTVETGSASRRFALEPSFDPDSGLGTKGEFDAFFIPTTPGPYTFHFTGNLGGPVNQSFTSGPETFSTVDDPTSVQFPVTVPSNLELSQKIDREIPRLTASITSASSKASDSSSTATTALIVGALGVVIGLVGVGFGIKANRKKA